MDYDKNECLDAIRLIKSICETRVCHDCPFAEKDGDECGLYNTPECWEDVKDNVDAVWRVWE